MARKDFSLQLRMSYLSRFLSTDSCRGRMKKGNIAVYTMVIVTY